MTSTGRFVRVKSKINQKVENTKVGKYVDIGWMGVKN